MRAKKIPLRTCVVTNEKLPKKELLRIVRTPEGEIIPDISGKANGRGAYIKASLEILEKAKKNNALGRHLEVNLKEEDYEKIKEVIENLNK
jgi:hypothetical protein